MAHRSRSSWLSARRCPARFLRGSCATSRAARTSSARSRRLPPRSSAISATHLFHIAQEATNNALRHARPTRIDIHLIALPDALVLSIRDDGVGLPAEPNPQSGVGLRLMRYRASLIGGVLQIGAAEKQGTA